MRSLTTSRWARRLSVSLAAGCVLAVALFMTKSRWGGQHAFGRAEAAAEAGEFGRAAELFQKMAEDNPGHPRAPEALFQAGRIQHLFLHNLQESVHVLRGVARTAAADPWGRRAQRLLAEIFEQRPDGCRQAIVEYQRFIGLDPLGAGNDEAQIAVARCCFTLGDYEQARADYELLLERYPESPLRPQALAGIASAYYVTGRYPLAVKNYRQVIAETGDARLGAEAGFGVASSLEESGDLAGALREFELVRAAYPNPGLVEERIARVRSRLEQQQGRGASTAGNHR